VVVVAVGLPELADKSTPVWLARTQVVLGPGTTYSSLETPKRLQYNALNTRGQKMSNGLKQC